MVILCGLLFLAMPLFAVSQSTSVPISAVQAAQPSPDVSTDLKLQQQKLDFYKERLDQQDKRIGDLNFTLTFFGVLVSAIGLLMTVMVVFFSLRATKEAVLAAKDEAGTEAKKRAQEIIEVWLRKDGQQILDEIKKAAAGKLGELDEERLKAHEHNEQLKKIIDEITSRPIDKDKPLSADQKEVVDKTAKDLESRAPKDYQSEDWFMLGVRAFESAKYETSADNFTKAAEAATDQVQQAKALLSKGYVLGQMNRNEEEIAVYDEMVRRYGDADEVALREQVAKALLNKGFRLGKMNKNEEAIVVYDEVMRRYGDATEAALREQVAKALNGIGFSLMCQAKKIWHGGDEAAATGLLKQALEKIEAALQRGSDEPFALGNLGYILFLLGRIDEAHTVLTRAIALGGEALRQAELKDADIHALPQDEAFRAMLKSL